MVDATSGSRQHSKKSRVPFASWYSGRYRPARGVIVSTVALLAHSLPRSLTLTHDPYWWSLNFLACISGSLVSNALPARSHGTIEPFRDVLTPSSPYDQVILHGLERRRHCVGISAQRDMARKLASGPAVNLPTLYIVRFMAGVRGNPHRSAAAVCATLLRTLVKHQPQTFPESGG